MVDFAAWISSSGINRWEGLVGFSYEKIASAVLVKKRPSSGSRGFFYGV